MRRQDTRCFWLWRWQHRCFSHRLHSLPSRHHRRLTTPVFNLTAQQAYLNMPDGEAVYSWGYGCNGAPAGFLTGGDHQRVLPVDAGSGPHADRERERCGHGQASEWASGSGRQHLDPVSRLQRDEQLQRGGSWGQQGLLACEAAPGTTVTYTFTASSPGTHAYYSGTQGDLQIEMGLYGAVVVLPAAVPANCTAGYHSLNSTAKSTWGEADFRLSQAAYDHPGSCYDREYLFQWAEMDPRIHKQAEAQVSAKSGLLGGSSGMQS